jgi:hypothetical protein
LEVWAAARMDTKFRDKKFRGNFINFCNVWSFHKIFAKFCEILKKSRILIKICEVIMKFCKILHSEISYPP